MQTDNYSHKNSLLVAFSVQIMPSSRASNFACRILFTLVAACIVASGCTRDDSSLASSVVDLPTPSPNGLQKVAELPQPYRSGDAIKGRIVFMECAECHSLKSDGLQDKGPTLYGVFGRAAATNGRYPFSEALRNSKFVWTPKRLDQWIFNPHETLPGTTMAYIGIRNDKRRRDVIAYLVAVGE